MPTREGFDLKTKIGWKNLIRRRLDKWSRMHILEDTFKLESILLKITHRFWKQKIKHVLHVAFEKGIINSEQLHELDDGYNRILE